MCDFFGKIIITQEMIVKHDHHCTCIVTSLHVIESYTYISYTFSFIWLYVLYHGGHFYHFEEITVQRKKAWGNFYYFLEISKGKKLHVPRWLSLKIVIVMFAVLKR